MLDKNACPPSVKELSNDHNLMLRRITRQPYLYIVEVHLNEHCNLNCYSCEHFSSIAEKEFTDIDEYTMDLKQLYKITKGWVKRFHLLGGEPLLNPNFLDFFKVTHEIFKKSDLDLVTNGILLQKQPDSVWEKFKEYNVTICLSVYPINLNLELINKKIKEYGLRSRIYANRELKETWYKSLIDVEGHQDCFSSFVHCLQANMCIRLDHGKISTCNAPFVIRHFNKFFNKNIEVTELDYLDIYKVKDYNEILDFVSKPIPFCRYCIRSPYEFGAWKRSKKKIEEWVPFKKI